MSLKNLLEEKLKERAAQIALEESKRNADTVTAQQEENQHKEKLRVDGLNQSIEEFDTKTGQMQALLFELKHAHKRATDSVIGARKEGQELAKATGEIDELFSNKEFSSLLQEGGIHSIEDLLEAEEYSEHEQVNLLKGLRKAHAEKKSSASEDIGHRRQAKVQAHQAITAERPDVAQKLTYKDIVSALEELIRDMGVERRKIYLETPEGQAALKAKIFDGVKQRRGQGRFGHRLESSREIDRTRTVDGGDIKDAKNADEYGAEEVKIALKDYYGQEIDKGINDTAEKNGAPQLREAVAIIENLPSQWQEIRSNLHALHQARQQTIDLLANLLGTDPQAPLFRLIKNYDRSSFTDPEKLATDFVDSKSSLNSLILGTGSSGTPDEFLNKTVVNQLQLVELVRNGDAKKVFLRTDTNAGSFGSQDKYPTALENPERIKIILAEQSEFYKKFQAVLTTPEEFIAKVSHDSNQFRDQINVRSGYSIGLQGQNSVDHYLEFDGRTYATLRDTPLAKLKDRLAQQENELKKTVGALKVQLSAKVEVDWAASELSAFSQEHWQEYREAEKIVKLRKVVEKTLPYLDLATSQLGAHMDQMVSVHIDRRSGWDSVRSLEFDSAKQSELQIMAENIEALNIKIKDLGLHIVAIDESASWEGNGFLGGKKKAREQEKTKEISLRLSYQSELEKLQKNYVPKKELDIKLAVVRSWLYEAHREGIDVKLKYDTLTLRKLVDEIKGQLDFTMTPEQVQLYQRYQELKKNEAEKVKEYEKFKK